MNDVTSQTNSILANALRILSGQVAPDSRPSPEWSEALVSALAAFFPPEPPTPADLIAPPDGGPGPRWHADQLLSLSQAQGTEPPASRARRAYHARMLGYALAPQRTEFRPSVTILVPVYNRAGPLVEAVQSCLDQTWRPVEILVIDDGSTDHPEAALAPFGAAVRVVRKPNGGVAGARNLGIGLATGDFIHFLDSDDRLLPRAVASKVAAFRAVADAELCYGQTQWIDMRVSPPALKEPRQHAVDDPARAMVVAFPFLLQTVMMPRWRLLAAAPFEEDLRRSSDFRYWQCLSFAGIKVIGSRELSTHLRRFHDSLHLTPEPQDDSHAVALMRGLRDLARHPQMWRHGADYVNIVAAKRAQYWFNSGRSDRVRAAAAEAIAALEQAARSRPSPLPLFAALRTRRHRLKRHGDWSDEGAGSIYRMMTDALDRCFAAALPLNDDDLAFWSTQAEAPSKDRALRRFFAVIQDRCAPGSGAALVDALLRGMSRIPRRSEVRRAAFLQRLLGARFAAAIVKFSMQRRRR
ncbi:MAG TPA: glycosyltransferase family A protein [Dongiaceae bacterium]